MKKIIFLVSVLIISFGLFAQEKIIIDEEAAKELNKLEKALVSAGIDFDLNSFIPETDDSRVEDVLTVDEYIESLENGGEGSRSTYINLYLLSKIYVLVHVGGGLYRYVWNGNVASAPEISGTDWDGVIHTRESTGGTIVETHYTYNPTYSQVIYNMTQSYPRICAQLFNNVLVYVPGFGYILTPQPFGDKECGTVSF
jgi:hypothetical protein